MNDQVVYLIRGLPSCGKSHTARRLAGAAGVVLETDEFFYTQVGTDPTQYDYSDSLLPTARLWNFDRFQEAVGRGVSPIVVDRGNGLNIETRQYARHAVAHGYQVELREPESPWWQEIRLQLEDKHSKQKSLRAWAERLAEMSRTTHRVPAQTILRWMAAWQADLTIDDILRFQTTHDLKLGGKRS